MSWSKERQLEYRREYYTRNRETILAKNQEWRTKNKERHLARAREWHHENRDVILPKKREYSRRTKESRAHKLRQKKYGITPDDFTKLLERQAGLCAICRVSKAAVVDHNHKTGAIRGILCSPCNTAIGLLKECPKRFEAAVKYLGTSA